MLRFQVVPNDAEMEQVVGKIFIGFLYKLIFRMVN